MDNLRLPSQDSTTGRGLKVTAYASLSAAAVFATGFLGVLNSVPGCSEAVLDFLQQNAIQLGLLVGVPAGLISAVTNLRRKDVENY